MHAAKTNPSAGANPASQPPAPSELHSPPVPPLPLPKIIYREPHPPGQFPPPNLQRPGRPKSVARAFREHARGRHNG